MDLLLKKIEHYIEQLEFWRTPRELYQPVEYTMKNGGKRIRPLMTLLACEMFGEDPELALPAAVGLEMFHNFTLMHDDIMDQAPMRRGQPAVHKKWNENTAILSGDVMFALAYQLMLKVPQQHLLKVLEIFNQTVIEVCEGQQYDMNFETIKKVSEADYLNMIRLKTAVLPAACLKTGAVIGGAPESEASNLYLFGESVGLAFQLKDDWLDVYGDEKVFGKKTGGDILANKKTWLYIKAFEMANKEQKQVLSDAFSNRIFNPEEKINSVKGIYTSLELNTLAMEEMEKYYKRAFEYLEQVEANHDAKNKLSQLAGSLFDRTT